MIKIYDYIMFLIIVKGEELVGVCDSYYFRELGYKLLFLV